MAPKKIAHAAVMFMTAPWHIDLTACRARSERLCFCLLACVLFPLVHFLLERPRLFLVDERQASHTLFQLERVEKGAILVVLERVVDLLVPYHPSVSRRYINQFEPKGVSHQIVGQDRCPLEACVGPSVLVRKADIESSDGDRLNPVCSLGNGPLDRFLVSFGED